MFSTLLVLGLALPSQSPDVAMQVRALVADLDAPQKVARDDAERKLIEFGPPALELLPEPDEDDSAEHALRLNRVRIALLKAQTEANLRASTVTLHAQAMPLAEVLASIEKQTGNKVVDYRREFHQQVDDAAVTLDLDAVPFWRAIDRLCAVVGLQVYPFAGEEGLALVASAGPTPADAEPTNITYSGAFRLKVRRLTLSHDFNAAAADLRVELDAAWEPRLRPMFVTASMAKLEIIDDVAGRLAPSNPQLVLEIPPQGRASKVDLTFQVAAPPRSSTKLKTISGTLDVLLPAESHTFRFSELDQGKKQEQRSAGVVVMLESPRTNGDLFEVPIRLTYQSPGRALESHRAWFYKNPAYLEGADGIKSAPGAIELVHQSDDELLLNLAFVAPGDLAKQTLVYRTPADITTLPVTFEFHDLPLP